MKLMIPPFRFVLFLTIVLFLFNSCTRETEVSIGGGSTPVFSVKGSAKLTSFMVSRPTAGTDGKAVESIWQIAPSTGGPGSLSLDALQRIQYGVVPEGYIQIVPVTGGPPPLTEGVTYRAEFGSAKAVMLSLRFAVRDGQTVNVGAASNLRNIPTH